MQYNLTGDFMTDALDLVRELIALPGPPGQEDLVRNAVAAHADRLGCAHKRRKRGGRATLRIRRIWVGSVAVLLAKRASYVVRPAPPGGPSIRRFVVSLSL